MRTALLLKGLLQCKFFIEKSDKTFPANAYKENLSVLRCIYPEKLRIKHQICTCPKIDNQKNRKNQLVYVTSRMCTAAIHIRTSVQLAWNLYRFKPLYHITIALCIAEFETLYILYILLQRQKYIEINENSKTHQVLLHRKSILLVGNKTVYFAKLLHHQPF